MRTTAPSPVLALLALAAACTATACAVVPGDRGATPGDASRTPPTPTRPNGPSSGATTIPGSILTVTVDDGAGSLTTWQLTCDPAGGNHPDPEAACEALARHGERALPPVHPDQVCTQLYGGPQRATVTGTWRGAPVLSRLSLTNGCEISRWKALVGLLPPAGG